MVTEEEYECAVHTVTFYNKNPHQKLCMDDAEKRSFSKALWIIKEYHKQEKVNATKNVNEKSR